MRTRTVLAALIAISGLFVADPAAQSVAHAQYCPAITLRFVLHDGRNVSIFYCESKRYWRGFSDDTINAGGDTQTIDGVLQSKPSIESFPRSSVRFLCVQKCPDLPATSAAETKEDVIVWQDGRRTAGRLSWVCETSGPCRIHQNGTSVQPTSPGWGLIPYGTSYIEFARAP